jgi:hypothetical protein
MEKHKNKSQVNLTPFQFPKAWDEPFCSLPWWINKDYIKKKKKGKD